MRNRHVLLIAAISMLWLPGCVSLDTAGQEMAVAPCRDPAVDGGRCPVGTPARTWQPGGVAYACPYDEPTNDPAYCYYAGDGGTYDHVGNCYRQLNGGNAANGGHQCCYDTAGPFAGKDNCTGTYDMVAPIAERNCDGTCVSPGVGGLADVGAHCIVDVRPWCQAAINAGDGAHCTGDPGDDCEGSSWLECTRRFIDCTWVDATYRYTVPGQGCAGGTIYTVTGGMASCMGGCSVFNLIPESAECSDGFCMAGEDCSNCPGDCGDCATNGECDDGEDCTSDLFACGPCDFCGNDFCGDDEDEVSCPADCCSTMVGGS